MHDTSFGVRVVCGKRDVDHICIRRSQPVVRVGVCIRMRTRLDIRIYPGSMAVWPGGGNLVGNCSPAMVA
jgi:hypothetical protein